MKKQLPIDLEAIEKIDFESPEFIKKFEKADKESEKLVASAKIHTNEEMTFIYY